MDIQTGILGALNPTVGTSWLDKLLPLAITLVWLALGVGLMFQLIPDVKFGENLWGILGPFVGAFLKSQAPAAPPAAAAAPPTQA